MAAVALVPADTVHEHLLYLLQTSSRKRIAREAGVSRQSIIQILAGQRTITVTTHERLMAVEAVRPPIPDGHVDALGSIRRVQALIASGHTVPWLAARACMSMRSVLELADGSVSSVPDDVAERLDAVFRVWQLHPGRSAQSRELGRLRRWALPFEWDEDGLDDPAHKPCRWSKPRRREIKRSHAKPGATPMVWKVLAA